MGFMLPAFLLVTMVVLGAALLVVRSRPKPVTWRAGRTEAYDALAAHLEAHAQRAEDAPRPFASLDGRTGIAFVPGGLVVSFRAGGLNVRPLDASALLGAVVREDTHVAPRGTGSDVVPMVRRVELVVQLANDEVPSLTVAALDGDVELGSDAHLDARDRARRWAALIEATVSAVAAARSSSSVDSAPVLSTQVAVTEPAPRVVRAAPESSAPVRAREGEPPAPVRARQGVGAPRAAARPRAVDGANRPTTQERAALPEARSVVEAEQTAPGLSREEMRKAKAKAEAERFLARHGVASKESDPV